MKRNPALRLGAIVLVLSVISISLATGTFAKYTTSFDGLPETISAAKFEFNLTKGESGGEYSSGTNFEIFKFADTGVYSDGTAYDDAGGAYADFIAPGTSGSLPLYIENLSQVDVTLSFTLDETNTGFIPIYYTLVEDTGSGPVEGTQRYSNQLVGEYAAGLSYQPLEYLATALGEPLEATDGTNGEIRDYVLRWKWDFQGNAVAYDGVDVDNNDAYDTAIGQAETAPSVTLAITAAVTQVDGTPVDPPVEP